MLRATVWFVTAAGRAMRSVVHRVDLGAALATVVPLLVGLYLVTFWRLSGQTPGKWLMGLKVVSIDGRPLTIGRAALRFVGYLASALPFYLGFLWILGPERRGVARPARRNAGHLLGAHEHVSTLARDGRSTGQSRVTLRQE